MLNNSSVLLDSEDLYSNSRINVWNNCPMQEKYIYVDRKVTGTNPAMMLGTFIHEDLEMIYEYCRVFYDGYVQPLPGEVLMAICVPLADEADGLEQALRYQAGMLALRYHNEYMPMVDKNMQVLGVEEKIVLPITTPKGRTVKFVQYVDLIYMNTLLKEVWSADHKSSGQLWTLDQVRHDAQQATYLANLRHLGYPVVGVVINNILTTKSALKKPTLEVFNRLTDRPNDARIQNVLLNLGKTIDRMIDGREDPHMNYTRSCAKCPFDGVCTNKMDGRHLQALRLLKSMPPKPDSYAMRVRDRADFIEKVKTRQSKLHFRAPVSINDDYDFVDSDELEI